MLTSSQVPSLTFFDRFSGPEYPAGNGEGTSRRRAKTVAPQLQHRMQPEASRSRTMSENVGPRKKPETHRLRTSSVAVKTEPRLGAIPQSPNSDVFQQTPSAQVPTQPQRFEVEAPVYETPPSKFFIPKGRRGQTLRSIYNSNKGQEDMLRDNVISWTFTVRMPRFYLHVNIPFCNIPRTDRGACRPTADECRNVCLSPNHNPITTIQCPNPTHASNAFITYRLHDLEVSDTQPTYTGFPAMNR